MMKKYLIFILHINSIIISAQYNKRTVIEDLNYDGIRDTIHSEYDGGGSFGGTHAKITNGKTNKSLYIDLFHSYALVKFPVFIPDSSYTKQNNYLLKGLLKETLPKERKTPEKTLLWCINSQLSKKSIKEKSKYFEYIFNPNTDWTKNKVTVPGAYYMYISKDSLSKIYNSDYNKDYLKKEEHKNILVYYPYSLKRARRPKYNTPKKETKAFEMIASSNNYKIFSSAHAIYIQKNKLYKWLFINDADVVGGPGKLRWDSIKDLKLINNYIILEQNNPPDTRHNVFIIDIETGNIVKLKYNFIDDYKFEGKPIFEDEYKVALLKDKFILYNDGESIEKILLEDIINEFKSYLK